MASSRQLEAAKLNVRAARRPRRATTASVQPARDARRDPSTRDLTEARRKQS